MVPNRKHFDEDLHDLNEKVLYMGNEIVRGFKALTVACEKKSNEIAETIVEGDITINELEVSINVDAYLIIAKQCPVASDLRRIITALKISNDLERIGDYAVNISTYLINTKNNNNQFLHAIIDLSNFVVKMLEGIMKAFKEENITLALEVNDMDEQLDERYKKEVKELIKIGKNKTDEESEEAFRAVLVLKQLERAGDHITNIAENIVYLVNGKRVELN
jgi:phosphate transport system protein